MSGENRRPTPPPEDSIVFTPPSTRTTSPVGSPRENYPRVLNGPGIAPADTILGAKLGDIQGRSRPDLRSIGIEPGTETIPGVVLESEAPKKFIPGITDSQGKPFTEMPPPDRRINMRTDSEEMIAAVERMKKKSDRQKRKFELFGANTKGEETEKIEWTWETLLTACNKFDSILYEDLFYEKQTKVTDENGPQATPRFNNYLNNGVREIKKRIEAGIINDETELIAIYQPGLLEYGNHIKLDDQPLIRQSLEKLLFSAIKKCAEQTWAQNKQQKRTTTPSRPATPAELPPELRPIPNEPGIFQKAADAIGGLFGRRKK
jgi:hypothetical protein